MILFILIVTFSGRVTKKKAKLMFHFNIQQQYLLNQAKEPLKVNKETIISKTLLDKYKGHKLPELSKKRLMKLSIILSSL